MLPQYFFDWWFSPWAYGANAAVELSLMLDRLAHRDGYRLWCKETRVAPDFPPRFNPAWHVAMAERRNELLATARLFAGLIAARRNNDELLDALSEPDRAWCISIAATQPMQACAETVFATNDTLEMRGLLELARRLEAGFPGMWSRLRLLLQDRMRGRVEALLASLAPDDLPEASPARAPRCWTLCHKRAAAQPGTENTHDGTQPVRPQSVNSGLAVSTAAEGAY